ncbi:MAG: TVP38/TMEM64 family protein [Saccharofermentanales bacterium]
MKNKTKIKSYTRTDLIKFISLLVILASFVAVTIYNLPFFMSLKDAAVRAELIERIRGAGFAGVLIAIGIQVIQVVLAVIPGEPIEIIAGILYGTWGGLALCLLGIFIGSLIIFLLVRLLGVSFVRHIIKDENIEKLKFLNDSKSLDFIVFVLFFIPGTPKDLLTYFIPLTPMKPLRFLIIATFARIPSVVTSTFIGASIGGNKWVVSIIVFVLTAILGIIGIQINNWYIKKRQKLSAATSKKAGHS